MKRYNTDNGGLATGCDDIKLFMPTSTWATKLSQLAKQKGKLIIMTYGFRENELGDTGEQNGQVSSYISNILDKHPENVYIICNSANIKEAEKIKKAYPRIRIWHNKKIHSNIALVEPSIAIFSGSEFGYSPYDEYGVGFHSEKIYNHMLEEMRSQVRKSEEIV